MQCESIVEELEDDIISLFASETDHVAKTLCSEVSGICVWCDIPSFIHLSKHVNAEDLNHSVDLIPIVFNIFFFTLLVHANINAVFEVFFLHFFSLLDIEHDIFCLNRYLTIIFYLFYFLLFKSDCRLLTLWDVWSKCSLFHIMPQKIFIYFLQNLQFTNLEPCILVSSNYNLQALRV